MTLKQELQALVSGFFKPALKEVGFEDTPVLIGYAKSLKTPVAILVFDKLIPLQAGRATTTTQTGSEAKVTSFYKLISSIGLFHDTDQLWPANTLSQIMLLHQTKSFARPEGSSFSIQQFSELMQDDQTFEDKKILFGAYSMFNWTANIELTTDQQAICATPLVDVQPKDKAKLPDINVELSE